MRNIDDGEKKKKKEKEKKKKKKITVEIVATNVVASRPPNGDRLQRRPLVPIIAQKCYVIWQLKGGTKKTSLNSHHKFA